MIKIFFLKKSKWIAHSYLITEEEAIKGGIYNFIKIFELPVTNDKITFAYLYFVVDDFLYSYFK